VIEYLVDYARVLAGGARPFDEAATRALVGRDVERAHNIAASENHGQAPELSDDLPLREGSRSAAAREAWTAEDQPRHVRISGQRAV
jgi:hypothetical protein